MRGEFGRRGEQNYSGCRRGVGFLFDPMLVILLAALVRPFKANRTAELMEFLFHPDVGDSPPRLSSAPFWE